MNASNHTESSDGLHNGWGAIIPIILMSIEGVCGNCLLITAIVTNKKLGTYIDAFVCNVAVMDLIVTGILLPAKIPILLHDRNVYSPSVCDFFAILAIMSCTGSVVSLAAVSLNKYLFVCHNHWYSRVFNKKSTMAMIAFSWAYSFAISCPPALGWSAVVYDSATASCTLANSEDGDLSYSIFLFIFALSLPTIVTTHCYGGIFWKMHRSRKKVEVNQPNKRSSTSGNYRQIYTMFVVSSLFSLSWLPYCMVSFMEIRSPAPPLFSRIATWLGLANSCMNCIVLSVVNKNYQEAYKRLLCGSCKARGKPKPANTHSNESKSKTAVTHA